MPTHPPLRIVRDGRSGPTPYTADFDIPRRSRSSTILLCGPSLTANEWIVNMLESQSYRVERLASVDVLEERLAPVDSIAFLDAAEGSPDLVGRVRALDEHTRNRILLATWRPAWQLVRQFLDAGISDFVKLPLSVSELVLRIELRARGGSPAVVEPSMHPAALSALELDELRFSDREYLLYAMLASHFGETVSRADILTHIWQRSGRSNRTSNVVDVYVRYLRVKLAAAVPRLGIRTVRGVGYVLVHQTQPTT